LSRAHRHLQRQRDHRPLPALLAWLAETKPDVACLQELKAPQERFPRAALEAAGYGAIWHGQSAWNGVAILRRGAEPIERRRGLPGDPTDLHSRYIEAEVGDLVVGCLYLPNGNPAPGPKFDYKLGWLKRFEAHARSLLDEKRPVVLAGDYNIIPTDLDVYVPDRWRDDALFRPEVRAAYERLLGQGWTDACGPCIRARRSTPSGTICAAASSATRACASTTCC
jgi:exodeoxyribonuclease-3